MKIAMFIILLDSFIFPLSRLISSVSVLISLNRGTYIPCKHNNNNSKRKKDFIESMVIVLWWIDLSMHNKNKIKCNRIAHFAIVKYVYYIYRHSQSHHHRRFVYISPAGGKRNFFVNSFWKIFVFTFRLWLILFHFQPNIPVGWVREPISNFCRSPK